MLRNQTIGLNIQKYKFPSNEGTSDKYIGATRGIGSKSRILKHCTQTTTSDLSSCIEQFIVRPDNNTTTLTESTPPPPSPYWSANFNVNFNVNATIRSIVIDLSGNVYVGGYFTNTGFPETSDYIAKFNPNTGFSINLVGGTNGVVTSIAIDSANNVYVMGTFSSAGGVSVNNIAKWNPNTSTWSSLGTGINNKQVANLQMSGLVIDSNDNVYVGGNFSSAGGVSVNNIAMWNPNTSTWSSLGNGISGIVAAIAIDSNDNVYVGGSFSSAGGVSVNNIAKWNPNTSTWTSLGAGVTYYLSQNSAIINCITIDSNDNVYVGGYFNFAGGSSNSVNNIAMWNPNTSTWSSLGPAFKYGVDSSVYTISIDSDNNIYIGGDFTYAYGASTSQILVNSIVKLNPNTNTWSALGSGAQTGDVISLAIDSNNNVYAGGSFNGMGGSFNYIAKWTI